MVTFFSGSNHHPRWKHDVLNWGHPEPAAGSHPCYTEHVATLGLGGVVICSLADSRTTGGDLLLQAISRYTKVPGPQCGVYLLVVGHRVNNTLVIYILMTLCRSGHVPTRKYLQRAPQFRSHTGQKITQKWHKPMWRWKILWSCKIRMKFRNMFRW